MAKDSYTGPEGPHLNSKGKGPLREYRLTTPDARLSKDRSFQLSDRMCVFGVSVFALAIRLYKLWTPTSVVFDEVHFGGFARKYIIGRFFMDVHPPLAKVLYAVVGWLAGYDGEFEFNEIGLDYNEAGVPYVAMRMLPAIMGVLTVILAYATLRASGCRQLTSVFGAGLVTIDNALATQSRYILLDSPLIFFMAITVYAFKRFENEIPFSKDWFRYLFLTGLGLGATVSSKWVGLFTIAWVGVCTIYQLWWIWGDLKVSPTTFSKHFGFRAIFLIALPTVFYMGMFYLHFFCVDNYGDGATFMSPEFQATLKHNPLVGNLPADVAYGSEIAIRHVNTRGGFLHSHEHLYETGSQQQQITLYPHRDENNIWVIEKVPSAEEEEKAKDNEDYKWTAPNYLEEPLEYVKDGDIVRLRHLPTTRRLHSHDHRPPVSEQEHQNEVSCYGFDGFLGDANDNFRVEIIDKKTFPGVARERLRTLESKFRLVHTMSGCSLFSHDVKLPKWAFEQQEVSCIKNGALPNTLWYIEDNRHPQLGPDAERVDYRIPSFFEKFIELNKVMWNVNKGLTESHAWESRPDSWPLLRRGINFWVKDHTQVYLLGNGVVWWSVTGIIALYLFFKALWIIRWQRGYRDFEADDSYSAYDSGVGSYIVGWALHYFPSFLMARQLFLHHYLGSLYFGILAFTQFWDFLTVRIIRNKLVGNSLTVLFFAGAFGFFYHYSPLIYGGRWTKELCFSSRFLDMDFECTSFLDTYEDYNKYWENKAVETEKPTESVEQPQPEEDAPEPTEKEVNQNPVDEKKVPENLVTERAKSEESDVPEFLTKRTDPEASVSVESFLTSAYEEMLEKIATMDEKERASLHSRIEAEVGDVLHEGSTVDTPISPGAAPKLEFRDADGNLLDEDVVRSLEAEGAIKVSTVKS